MKIGSEEFQNIIADGFRNEFPDASVEIAEVHKINNSYTGLKVSFPDKNPIPLSPIIDLNRLYGFYLVDESTCIEEVLERALSAFKKDIRNSPVIPAFSWENAKEKVFIRLCGTVKNTNTLTHAPHRPFLDMSVTYHLTMDGSNNLYSILVDDTLQETLGVTEQKLYEQAISNKGLSPVTTPKIQTISSMIGSSDDGPDTLQLYVITNEAMFNGASMICFSEILKAAAKIIGENYYILPSSLHEVIAVPETIVIYDKNELLDMVRVINSSSILTAPDD